jgi:hypothetical protein
VDRADNPRGPSGWSARPNGQFRQPLTSHFYRWNSNADSPRGHRGVREVRVLPITASNGKGEYIYSKPRVGVSLGTLKGPYSLVELSLSSLSLTHLA